MHAVVVCSRKNGASNFATYPDVLTPIEDVKNEAVITRDYDGNWIWKPQATGSEIKRLQSHQQKYPKYRHGSTWHSPFIYLTNGAKMA